MLGLAAVAAGRHVLVEKPMATTVDEATRMFEAAEAAGVTVYVAENVPYLPISKRLRGIVTSGEPLISGSASARSERRGAAGDWPSYAASRRQIGPH